MSTQPFQAYDNFYLSAALAPNQLAAIAESTSVVLKGLTFGTTMTIGQQSVTMYDMAEDVRSFNDRPSFTRLNRNSVNSPVRVERQGIGVWEATAVMYIDKNTNKSYDIIKKDAGGIRVLACQKATDEKLVAVVSIFEFPTEPRDDDGDEFMTVVFANAGRVMPDWE